MKTIQIITAVVLGMSIFSCKENSKEVEIHQADDQVMHSVHNLDVEVDNKFDPICGMETAGHVSDTIHYAGNVYGFCNPGCKEEFARNPEIYLDKLN